MAGEAGKLEDLDEPYGSKNSALTRYSQARGTEDLGSESC